MSEGNLDHEQELNWLLAELGETLGRRERVLEGMKRARTQARLHEVTVEAEQPFESWDQEMLVEDLQRELEHQRAQELELQQVLDLLVRQRELEDQLFAELDGHLLWNSGTSSQRSGARWSGAMPSSRASVQGPSRRRGA